MPASFIRASVSSSPTCRAQPSGSSPSSAGRATMDQGRQGRDQVDTAVVQDVRGQRRAARTSCAGLQSWQLSPHACNTGADQGLVADELEGEADQDRREGGEPRTLCRLPNGGGRHPTTNVPGDSAADRGTTAAATTRASMKRSIVTRSSAIDRRNASPSSIVRAARAAGSQPYLPSGFQGRCKIATLHAGFGVIRGMSDETNVLYVFVPDCGDDSFRLFQATVGWHDLE